MSALRLVSRIAVSLCVLSGCVAQSAGAYATLAPPPSPAAGTGLPDGRVYEEVSPPNKHGYQAGALGPTSSRPVNVEFSLASPDGDAVAFESTGPAAEMDTSGLNEDFVAERTSRGWTSRSATARGLGQNETLSLFFQTPKWRDYSPDLSHLAYGSNGAEVPGAPMTGYRNFYLLGANPLEAPTWLFGSVANPSLEEKQTLDEQQPNTELVGMSPDAGIVYIAYDGRLMPQDASRSGWGLYEYRNGTLSEAGVLPDGSVPASGAMPPSSTTSTLDSKPGENNPASQDNQLSEDGKRVLFVASDELYVHKIEADGSEHSVLVSASQLPGHVGEAASDGVALFENPTQKANVYGYNNMRNSTPTYAYASPDGSQVFFESEDQLTSQAPSGSGLKVYDFDVDTGALEYLPGVALGGIVTAAQDGSSFVFVNGAGSPPELDLWTTGANGGHVNQIVQLPGGGFVGPGRLVSGDSVLVFQAQAPIAGFNDAGGEQVYRYDIKANELDCISCPPAGVSPSGNAYLSAIDQYFSKSGKNEYQVVNDARGVSADGERIFFASPDPLVGRDTDGNIDTYEWENGTVFLLSSGTSSSYSPFLDNSVSGGDVFFATADELVQGDNDAGFDVYDARIPRPGDTPPPSAAPCTGDVCQGPPSVAQLLGAPPSATFNGAGNLVEQSTVKPKSAPRRLSRAQKLASALNACRKRKSKHKRVACERQARKRYPATGATATHNGRRGK